MTTVENYEEGMQYLNGMNARSLKLLMDNGITSMRRLANSVAGDLSDIDGITEKRAKNIIYSAREKLGMCDFITADSMEENYKWFTTGSEAVDDLMDGGITTGRITEVFGAFKSGKSNLCNTVAVTVQLPEEDGGLDGDVVFIDTEGTFTQAKIARIARRFGIDPEKALQRIHVAKVFSSDHQLQMIEAVEKLMQAYSIKLIVVDSLMALLRNEYIGIGQLAPRQAMLNNMIHFLSQLADTYNLAVLLTNQVTVKMAGTVCYEDAIGGNIVQHGCHFRYRVKARGASYNETLERSITVVDSVDLAPGTAKFYITEAGIADDEKINYVIDEPSDFELKPSERCDDGEENSKSGPKKNASGRYECPGCEKDYSSQRTLVRHVKKYHPELLAQVKEGEE